MSNNSAVFRVGDLFDAVNSDYLYDAKTRRRQIWWTKHSRLEVTQVNMSNDHRRRVYSIELALGEDICVLFDPVHTWTKHFKRVAPLTLLAEAAV